jgi:hypothetical protein
VVETLEKTVVTINVAKPSLNKWSYLSNHVLVDKTSQEIFKSRRSSQNPDSSSSTQKSRTKIIVANSTCI